MNSKPRPNRRRDLEVLSGMTPEDKLRKVFELSAFSRELFLAGPRQRFPDASAAELKQIFLVRLEKCHNRNY